MNHLTLRCLCKPRCLTKGTGVLLFSGPQISRLDYRLHWLRKEPSHGIQKLQTSSVFREKSWTKPLPESGTGAAAPAGQGCWPLRMFKQQVALRITFQQRQTCRQISLEWWEWLHGKWCLAKGFQIPRTSLQQAFQVFRRLKHLPMWHKLLKCRCKKRKGRWRLPEWKTWSGNSFVNNHTS